MNLSIEHDDVVLLRELLDAAYRDLKVEIADTDNSRFKAALRERERRLVELLDRFGGPLRDRDLRSPNETHQASR